MENLSGQKKVWTGSEKVMGYIVALGLLFGGGYGLYILLPFLISIVTNLAIFVGLVTGLSVITYVIISQRQMISIGYQIIIKKIWKALINSNPIAIMEIQYDTWMKQKEKLNQNIVTLIASKEELLDIMNDNKDVANTNFKEAQKAKELAESKNSTEYSRKATNNAIKAQRRVESNKLFLPKLQAIETALDYCERVHEAWEGDLELLKDDINMKKRDLKVLSRTNGVFEMAKSYISGSSNERIMYEEANQAYAEQVSLYVANIKRFADQTKDWVLDKDIQQAIETEEGSKYLSMYDETSFNKLTDFKGLMEDKNNVSFVEASNKLSNVETSTFTKSNTNFDNLK